MSEKIFTNATIVTPEEHFTGSIVIDNGIITDVCEDKFYTDGDDVSGAWIIPGIIDIHSDYLEREVNPRPNTGFPLPLAFRHLDVRAVSSGVTTIYNGISFRDEEAKNRSFKLALEISSKLQEYIDKGHLTAKHVVHARVDTTGENILKTYDQIMALDAVKFAVYNDHTPGQRQFRDLEKYAAYSADRTGRTKEEVLAEVEERQKAAEGTGYIREILAEKLMKTDVVIGSHDDTTIEHVEDAIAHGATISEFPTTLEAARYAKDKGMIVAMGSPNYILGRSQSGNMSCREAMAEGLVDVLCSDYHIPSMLGAVYTMISEGADPSEAVNMITLNPAKAVKIDIDRGSLEAGKRADLTFFRVLDGMPVVGRVYVDGVARFQCRCHSMCSEEINV